MRVTSRTSNLKPDTNETKRNGTKRGFSRSKGGYPGGETREEKSRREKRKKREKKKRKAAVSVIGRTQAELDRTGSGKRSAANRSKEVLLHVHQCAHLNVPVVAQ